MTKGELKAWLDAFEDFPDDMPVAVNVGLSADNIQVAEGQKGYYIEGWSKHEGSCLCDRREIEGDLFGERRGAMGQL